MGERKSNKSTTEFIRKGLEFQIQSLTQQEARIIEAAKLAQARSEFLDVEDCRVRLSEIRLEKIKLTRELGNYR